MNDFVKSKFNDPRLQDPAKRRTAEAALEKHLWAKAYDSAVAEVDDLGETQKALPGIVQRLERLEARPAKADVTLHQPPEKPKPVTQRVPKTIEIIAATVVAEILRRQRQIDPDETIKAAFPGVKNKMVRDQTRAYHKAASSTATTVQSGWAEEISASITGQFWADLENVSVAAALLSRGFARPIEFGLSKAISFPFRDPSKKIPAAWVAENATIPVDEGSFLSVTLNRYKKAVITVLSEELISANSVVNAVELVGDLMRQDLSEGIDGDLLDNTGGVAGVRPAGLLNGAPTQASAGATIDNILTDLAFLRAAMSDIRAQNPVLILHPDRVENLRHKVSDGVFPFRGDIDGGLIGGMPYIASRNVTDSEVVAMDGNRVFIDLGTPEIKVSEHATLVMLNADGIDPKMGSAPDQVDIAGSVKVSDAAGVTGGPAAVKSMLQQYSVGLRSVQPLSWGSVGVATAYVSGVAW